MTKKYRAIPNPNKITDKELEFIQGQYIEKQPSINDILLQETKKAKGRMISMSDNFWNLLNTYLKNNPTEGSRSSFIVRIVAEYIKTKTNNTSYN